MEKRNNLKIKQAGISRPALFGVFCAWIVTMLCYLQYITFMIAFIILLCICVFIAFALVISNRREKKRIRDLMIGGEIDVNTF